MEFLEEEEGDEFLEEAIICPVPGCLNKGHIFKKYNIYVTHYTGSWRIFFYVHLPKSERDRNTRHFKRVHLTQYNPPLTGKLTENAKFIDPENFKKPSKRHIKKNENRPSLSDFKGGRNVTI